MAPGFLQVRRTKLAKRREGQEGGCIFFKCLVCLGFFSLLFFFFFSLWFV